MDNNVTRESKDGVRWYTDGDSRGMSVTEILNYLEEDDTGLQIWKQQNDGRGDNPHHAHLYWYSAPRGTLCHVHALRHFEDVYDGDDMWGEEETNSIQQVVRGPTEDDFTDDYDKQPSTDNEDVVYSLLKNRDTVTSRDEYEALFEGSVTLTDILHGDVEFFVESFTDICNKLGVTDDSVVTIEKLLLNDDTGYGGQTDMVYEDPEGNTVVVDLKTSSGLRQKHRLQAVAYAKAIEQADDVDVTAVDRVEVWRIHPDSETWKVHSHTVPEHFEDIDNYTDDYWFKDKYGNFEYESLDDMWETFCDLAKTAHDSV